MVVRMGRENVQRNTLPDEIVTESLKCKMHERFQHQYCSKLGTVLGLMSFWLTYICMRL